MATIKLQNGNVITKDGKVSCSCCGCSLEPIGGSCELEFIYVNTNEIQDDAFNIQLLKSDGTWVTVGNIDGVCEVPITPQCRCSKVDTKTFKFTIDQSFVSEKAECAIEFRSILTKNNGCGTFGTFDISGPNGVGFGGLLGDSGLIDITVACFPPA
jgi:hypothetical protein